VATVFGTISQYVSASIRVVHALVTMAGLAESIAPADRSETARLVALHAAAYRSPVQPSCVLTPAAAAAAAAATVIGCQSSRQPTPLQWLITFSRMRQSTGAAFAVSRAAARLRALFVDVGPPPRPRIDQ